MWRRHQALLRRISPLKHPAGWPARGIGCYYATEPEGRKPKTAPLQSPDHNECIGKYVGI
uniref:Uncharacterized protein n=1 Tax=Oryza sativa subsp. japonica TaxID=39947 RepID=Q338L3_ORYSJ|nr:hypothetical protein LOC_Os10g25730 [Oryza sativa Japonica Group]